MITLDSDSPQGIDQMLEYLYTFEAPYFVDATEAKSAYIIADKYDLQDLKSASYRVMLEKLKEGCETFYPWTFEKNTKLLLLIEEIWTWAYSDTRDFKETILRGFLASAPRTIEKKQFQDFMWAHIEFGVLFMRNAVNTGRTEISTDLSEPPKVSQTFAGAKRVRRDD